MARIRFLSRRSYATHSPRTWKRWLATVLAAGMALGAASCPGARAANTSGPGPIEFPKPPRGLIALLQYPGCSPSVASVSVADCPTGALLDQAASNPAIAGLMIRVDWADMYVPSWSGMIDWSITDAVFAQAAKYNKFVVLSFVPGFGSPTSVLTNPMVETDSFCIQYGLVPFVAKAGDLSTLPMPWDPTYQSLWFNFLQQVSLRYASNPLYGPIFKMITAAGPTSISEEMSLPGAGGPGQCTAQIATDLAKWKKHKYTPTKYYDAWGSVFTELELLFRGVFVSLAVYPGLPIGATSNDDPSQATATPKNVATTGTTLHPLNFAVEANGLTPNSPGHPNYDLVTSYVGKLVTGFEFATSALNSPEKQGDATNPVRALCLSLQTGLDAQVDYLEIYQADAASSNPVVQTLLQTAADQLLSPPGTLRTPLPCNSYPVVP
jgi:hypothetical protein